MLTGDNPLKCSLFPVLSHPLPRALCPPPAPACLSPYTLTDWLDYYYACEDTYSHKHRKSPPAVKVFSNFLTIVVLSSIDTNRTKIKDERSVDFHAVADGTQPGAQTDVEVPRDQCHGCVICCQPCFLWSTQVLSWMDKLCLARKANMFLQCFGPSQAHINLVIVWWIIVLWLCIRLLLLYGISQRTNMMVFEISVRAVCDHCSVWDRIRFIGFLYFTRRLYRFILGVYVLSRITAHNRMPI